MAYVNPRIGTIVARLPGVQPHLDSAAQSVLSKVKAQASASSRTGNYMRSLGIESIPGKSGVTDRIVYSDDPAAGPIEWGAVVGKKNPTYIPGKYWFTKATS